MMCKLIWTLLLIAAIECHGHPIPKMIHPIGWNITLDVDGQNLISNSKRDEGYVNIEPVDQDDGDFGPDFFQMSFPIGLPLDDIDLENGEFQPDTPDQQPQRHSLPLGEEPDLGNQTSNHLDGDDTENQIINLLIDQEIQEENPTVARSLREQANPDNLTVSMFAEISAEPDTSNQTIVGETEEERLARQWVNMITNQTAGIPEEPNQTENQMTPDTEVPEEHFSYPEEQVKTIDIIYGKHRAKTTELLLATLIMKLERMRYDAQKLAEEKQREDDINAKTADINELLRDNNSYDRFNFDKLKERLVLNELKYRQQMFDNQEREFHERLALYDLEREIKTLELKFKSLLLDQHFARFDLLERAREDENDKIVAYAGSEKELEEELKVFFEKKQAEEEEKRKKEQGEIGGKGPHQDPKVEEGKAFEQNFTE